MCNALRELMKEDLVQAENIGRLELISKLMNSQKISADQAMDMVEIPTIDRELYRTKLQ